MGREASEFSEFNFGYVVTRLIEEYSSANRGIVGSSLIDCITKLSGARGFFQSRKAIGNYLVKEIKLTEEQAEAILSSRAAPFVPTQRVEKELPIDLFMESLGVFLFLQYKRADAVVSAHKKLKDISKFSSFPYFRVHFNKKIGEKVGDFNQWKSLLELEKYFHKYPNIYIGYVAPAFHKFSELSELNSNGIKFQDGKGRSYVVTFRASSFDLPDNNDHHIAYDGVSGNGWRFSEEEKSVEGIVPIYQMLEQKIRDRKPVASLISDIYVEVNKICESRNIPISSLKEKDSLWSYFGKVDNDLSPESARGRLGQYRQSEIQGDQPQIFFDGFTKIMQHGEDEVIVEKRWQFLQEFYTLERLSRSVFGMPPLIGTFED